MMKIKFIWLLPYFSSGVWAGLRRIASSSSLVVFSVVDSTGAGGGGDKLRLGCCVAFVMFIDGPEFSLENVGRDNFAALKSPLSIETIFTHINIHCFYK